MIINYINIGFEKGSNNLFVPTLNIKIGNCNMKCINENDAVCPFSSSKEKSLSYTYAKKLLNENPQVSQIIISGGEPLLYKSEIEKMLNELYKDGMYVVIKTNGTLPILNPLGKNYKIGLYDVYIPSNNFPVPGKDYAGVIYGTNEVNVMKEKSIDINNLLNIAMYSSNYIFNFEVSNKEDFDTIESIISKMYEQANNDDFIANFFKKYPIENHIAIYTKVKDSNEITDICFKNGWCLTNEFCNN